MNITSSCPVCGKEKLNIGWKKKEIWIDGKAYSSLILMNECSACGYESPKSCNIELLIDGDNPDDIPQLSTEERENVLNRKRSDKIFSKPAHRKYDLLSFIRGNGLATEEYLKELEESNVNITKDHYSILAGKKRAHVTEQVKNIPKCRAILDDHLIDTEDSKLVLRTQNETNTKTGDMIQHFYFLSSEGVFYRIIVRPNGRQDAPRRMTPDEMKKILSKQSPDLYLEYFPLTQTDAVGEDNSLDNYSDNDPRPKTYENAPRVPEKPVEPTPEDTSPDTASDEAKDSSSEQQVPGEITEERREELKKAYAEDDTNDMAEDFFNSMEAGGNVQAEEDSSADKTASAEVPASEEGKKEQPAENVSKQDAPEQEKSPEKEKAPKEKKELEGHKENKTNNESIMKALPIPKNGFIRPKKEETNK